MWKGFSCFGRRGTTNRVSLYRLGKLVVGNRNEASSPRPEGRT